MKRTNWFLVFFHMSPFSRIIFPVFLGTINYDLSKWIVYDMLGALLFNFSFVWIGFLAGSAATSFQDSFKYSSSIELFFLALLLVWLLIIKITFSHILENQIDKQGINFDISTKE